MSESIHSESWISPVWPDLPSHVRALATTKQGGVSEGVYGAQTGGLNLGLHVGDERERVLRNRAKLAQQVGFDVTFLSQVHGKIVVDAQSLIGLPDQVKADAVLSSRTKQACAVLTADCLPVLFCDQSGRFVAAAHAGWRGLLDGVLTETVLALRQHTRGSLTAWLGPAISARAFEVGAEVRTQFVDKDRRFDFGFIQKVSTDEGQGGEKFWADLYGLARFMLNELAVESVFGGEYCTYTDSEKFYSYRRDGVTGRMASLIWVE